MMESRKKNVCCRAEKKHRKKAADEHAQFKRRMLSQPQNAVYDACSKISFYECIHAYFKYSSRMDPEFVQACRECETPTALLWEFYLQWEELRADTWEGIDEMLLQLAREHRCPESGTVRTEDKETGYGG